MTSLTFAATRVPLLTGLVVNGVALQLLVGCQTTGETGEVTGEGKQLTIRLIAPAGVSGDFFVGSNERTGSPDSLACRGVAECELVYDSSHTTVLPAVPCTDGGRGIPCEVDYLGYLGYGQAFAFGLRAPGRVYEVFYLNAEYALEQADDGPSGPVRELRWDAPEAWALAPSGRYEDDEGEVFNVVADNSDELPAKLQLRVTDAERYTTEVYSIEQATISQQSETRTYTGAIEENLQTFWIEGTLADGETFKNTYTRLCANDYECSDGDDWERCRTRETRHACRRGPDGCYRYELETCSELDECDSFSGTCQPKS